MVLPAGHANGDCLDDWLNRWARKIPDKETSEEYEDFG